MRVRGATRVRTARGAVAVEFALLVVPMLYLVFGSIGFAYMFSFRQAMSQAASEGARAAVGGYSAAATICAPTGPYSATSCPAQNAAATAVANALSSYSMRCGTSNLTCTITVGKASPTTTEIAAGLRAISGCATGRVCISVVVSYPYRDHSLLPTVPGLGFVLPDNLSFTSVLELS